MKQHREELPVFVKWIEFLEWLLLKTEKFPKKARFTFVSRINNLALDIVEDLVDAKYTKEKVSILKRVNLKLEKLRVLLRISYNQKYLNLKSYEYAMKSINESGAIVGNWIKSRES